MPTAVCLWGENPRTVLNCLILGAVSIVLAGCPRAAKLPDCLVGLKGNAGGHPVKIVHKKGGQQVLIGIDGSGSMLGFAQAGNQSVWPRVLQSISQGILINDLQPITYRIGAGVAEGPIAASITQSVDPCFFKGCAGFRQVESSLQTLWTIQSVSNQPPLRLLVSDLEVNQNDITSLLRAIQSDLDKGASVGILGLKAPFTGNVFDANAKIIHKGNVNRPLYILATGPNGQLRSVLGEIKKTLAMRGITGTEMSIIDSSESMKTIKAQWVAGVPATAARPVQRINIDGTIYRRAGNPDYQFIRLSPNATGLLVATAKKVSKGSGRPDFGIADLEYLSITGEKTQQPQGISINHIQVSGANIIVELDVDQSAVTGAYRIVIGPGNIPDQWWIDWDRPHAEKMNAGQKTEGFLNLMNTLSKEIARSSNSPPAAAMCIALDNQIKSQS